MGVASVVTSHGVIEVDSQPFASQVVFGFSSQGSDLKPDTDKELARAGLGRTLLITELGFGENPFANLLRDFRQNRVLSDFGGKSSRENRPNFELRRSWVDNRCINISEHSSGMHSLHKNDAAKHPESKDLKNEKK